MTRQDFIEAVKADRRVQAMLTTVLIVSIMAFGGLGTFLVRDWEDDVFDLHHPYLWILLGGGVAFAFLAFAILRNWDKRLLKCPHCRKNVGHLSSQVVVASGRCGHCGARILEDDV